MAVETFTDAVVVDGSQDITQLRVQAHSTQNQPLQTWENNAGNPLVRLNSDGRLELGDVTIATTPNAFLEADQGFTSASPIKQGVQSRGIVSGVMSDPLAWSVHELEFQGTGGVSSTQKALRGKLMHANTGNSVGADLRAGDFEVENQAGSGGQKVGQATGVYGRVNNGANGSTAYLNQAAAVRGEIVNNSGDTIDDAAAFEVVSPTNTGTIGKLYGLRVPNLTVGSSNYAIHTGQGLVHLEDAVELRELGTVPSTPSTDLVRLYPKADGRIYLKNDAGVEYDLTEGVAPAICNGRLTLSTGVPFPTADLTAITTLYFTPCRGDKVTLYDGTRWRLYSIPANDVSFSLSGLTAHRLYDIFLYDNAGSLTLEATAWNAPSSGNITGASHPASPIVITSNGHGLANDQVVTITGVGGNTAANGTWRVANGTANTFEIKSLGNAAVASNGAYTSGGTWVRADQNTSRVTQLALQDGVYVRSGAATRRYLGTLRISGVAGQSEDNINKRHVWNYYHRVPRQLFNASGVGHTYTSTSMRAWNNDFVHQLEYVVGLIEERPKFWYTGRLDFGAVAGYAMLSFGANSRAGNDAQTDAIQGTATGMMMTAQGNHSPFLSSNVGYNYLQMTELGNSGVTIQSYRFFGEVWG